MPDGAPGGRPVVNAHAAEDLGALREQDHWKPQGAQALGLFLRQPQRKHQDGIGAPPECLPIKEAPAPVGISELIQQHVQARGAERRAGTGNDLAKKPLGGIRDDHGDGACHPGRQPRCTRRRQIPDLGRDVLDPLQMFALSGAALEQAMEKLANILFA